MPCSLYVSTTDLLPALNAVAGPDYNGSLYFCVLAFHFFLKKKKKKKETSKWDTEMRLGSPDV